jgi:hypothetical protein
MGRKSKQHSIKAEPSVLGQEDKLIADLIEQRKIQQEALTKIMDSMDSMLAQLNYSTSRLLDKGNAKRLSKKENS